MSVRSLVNIERLTTAHVNSIDGSMTYESGVEYKANTTVSYNGSLYTANVDIEDTDTDTPDIAPDRWSLTINASEAGTSGDISALAARVSTLEETVGDETDGLVKDVDDLQDMFKYDSAPLTGFDGNITKVGNIKVLYLSKPTSAMTYNVEYAAGTLPDDFKPIIGTLYYATFTFNNRDYVVFISSLGVVNIKCLTDTLPSDGKPTLGGFITFT